MAVSQLCFALSKIFQIWYHDNLRQDQGSCGESNLCVQIARFFQENECTKGQLISKCPFS